MNTKTLSFFPRGLVAALLLFAPAVRAQVNLNIGTMQPDQEVVITYEVTLNASLLPAVTQISNQGSISGTGFTSPRLTDDPETAAANDSTITTLQNDPPVLAAGNIVSYTENGATATVSPGLTATDSDSSNFTGATVSITSGIVAGDTLSFADQNGITGSYNDATGVLSLSGSASVADYQAALRSVSYSSTSEDPTAGGSQLSRTIAYVANDGIVDSSAATATVNLTATNDSPLVTAGNAFTYTEGDPATAISSALTVTDADNAGFASAIVSISGGFHSGDSLSFSDQNGISGSYNSGTGVLTLSGSASLANYQTALRSVKFSSNSHDPTAGGSKPTRTVSFTVNDGTDDSAAATSTISITAVNDNPVGGTDSIQRAPNGDVKVKAASLLANDSDPDGGTVSITAVTSPSTGGASLSMSGGWIFYTHAGTSADTFTYTLSDGQGGSTLVTVNVTIQDQDAQSGPALTPSVDGGGARVAFSGIPGRTYTIQCAPSAAGPWSDCGAAAEGDAGNYTYTDSSGLPANFYRAVYRP